MKVAYSVPDFCKATGIGRDAAYKLIRSRQLPARKVGTKWIIPASSVDALLSGNEHVSLNDRPERLADLN